MIDAQTLIDAGPIIAYYKSNDRWHKQVRSFFEKATSQFITTSPCLTEAMFALRASFKVQNELLLDLARGLYISEPLLPEDFSRIAELNAKYSDIPSDFADLSLIAISERLDIQAIATLDSDFDIYRRYKKRLFKRILQ